MQVSLRKDRSRGGFTLAGPDDLGKKGISFRTMTDRPLEGYPRSFPEFVDHVDYSGRRLDRLGYPCGAKVAYRFCNRFRLAKSFDGMALAGYSEDSVAGYNGLLSVFLAYSAYELLWKVLGMDEHELPALMDADRERHVHAEFEKYDPEGVFFNFLRGTIDDELRNRLDRFKSGDFSQAVYLGVAIHHMFAHGYLSAHPKGAFPQNISKVCESVYGFLMKFMDERFSVLVTSCAPKQAATAE